MCVEIAIARSEDKRAAKLKRVLPQLVLPVSFARGAHSCRPVEGEEELPDCPLPKPRRAIGSARLVDQKRERDAGFRAEGCGVVATSQADRGDARTGVLDLTLVVAQPGDVLAAEYSAVVAKERDNRRAGFPQGAKPDLGSCLVRQLHGGERRCDRRRHARSLARKLGHPWIDRSY